ncbi:MAG: carboxypeptidase-like regulatory domain-containing protein [Bacteroidales bacterium]|nr:carboxypeptidase-like regulatory domain-containing protein [Bacteroidales bacterium]
MLQSRVSAIFLFLVLGSLSLTAQDSLLYRELTLPDTVCTVESAFRSIERQTGLSFSYNSDLISKKRIVTLQAGQLRLIDVLKRILNDPGLDYTIIGRHLVIFKPIKSLASNPESPTDSVNYFEIRGRVLDRNDRQPLPYSSIYLNGKAIGTVSNNDGEFVLKLSSRFIYDTVNISCIGYKNITSPVASLINTNRDYLLKTDVVSIQEVVIRKVSPVLLLQSATEKIRENYPQRPSVLTSFYRETVQQGNRFMMVSEAVLENFKSGYHGTGIADQLKILKGRKNEDISSEDTIVLKLKAGLNTMLMLDVVMNMPDFLTGESTAEYNYRLSDIVIDNGQDNYAIEFSPKSLSLTSFYSGRILLGIKDLAFKWVEFYVDPEQLERATNLFVVKKPSFLKVKVLKAHYKVAFRESSGKYYLHLIQAETEFRVRNKNKLSGSVYKMALGMVVTDIDTENASRFPFREAAKPNEFFTEQVGEYDESFWGEYNFVTPDESLENALVRLSRQWQKQQEEAASRQ